MKTTDIYEQVTTNIISQLEQGIVPWKSPYFSKVGFPRNFSSGKAYQGINVFLLASRRFTSPYFLTFIQAKELGGHVRKGERGSLVVKYGTYTKHEEDAGAAAGSEEEAERRGYLKGYTVFHASQIEGIEFPTPENLPELSLTEKTARAREIIAGMPNPPAFREGSAVPCYRPGTDSVNMPEGRYFDNETVYYSTLFHELAHSTGHASRLSRKSLIENKGINADGDTARQVYAEEELVAEMGAAFLSAHAGIEEDAANSAAYLQSWINALKSKDARTWIIRAASQAQKAANYILNIQPEVQA
ncbi:Antirestriction protein ArdC [Prosthecobacter debontii]|uniref:Antirestriction protein ArdC n=1 Tax=Prosthecobacter debontii TaxID=48467 RepID=A0A1T4YKH5_9BACT|nr:ArdC-like ssDNA-binding domain-containing protein [Prosthecobacter debontii]SKB01761.1 Antirestriction protein ArdC [Prosthecobacter debontii]